jgi:hypothetical protein
LVVELVDGDKREPAAGEFDAHFNRRRAVVIAGVGQANSNAVSQVQRGALVGVARLERVEGPVLLRDDRPLGAKPLEEDVRLRAARGRARVALTSGEVADAHADAVRLVGVPHPGILIARWLAVDRKGSAGDDGLAAAVIPRLLGRDVLALTDDRAGAVTRDAPAIVEELVGDARRRGNLGERVFPDDLEFARFEFVEQVFLLVERVTGRVVPVS